MPPGGEGKITIRVDTAGYGGKLIKKNIVVHTNDADHQKLYLTISGVVEKFASIKPERIFLNGHANKDFAVTVSIIPEIKYPFSILGTSALNGDNISLKLEKKNDQKLPEYILTVKNTAKVKGKYFDSVIIKTDNRIHPDIRIPVLGNIL
ncbi:MAG: hypothetical protein EHM85_07005 [Desulfobacteraceae bacterium]|nr:MAG: hypothetical protein EHM85_07005 [Desulfobacteraceae bacterium]